MKEARQMLKVLEKKQDVVEIDNTYVIMRPDMTSSMCAN